MILESCFVLNSGPCPPAFNMALDEALLESIASLSDPVLRFYGWTEPAATFGYSQHFRDVALWTPLRPLIRRPTGGGLVPHDADWTYSLVVPPAHPWYELKARDSYRRMHEWIHRAFSSLGVPTQLAQFEQKTAPGRCFVGAEQFDLLRGGAKIAGAAQRRNRQGLLIQGSIQPAGCLISRAQWEQAMVDSAEPNDEVRWSKFEVDHALTTRAEVLKDEKYAQTRYNEQR
jgi:lipoate-protein ligase A